MLVQVVGSTAKQAKLNMYPALCSKRAVQISQLLFLLPDRPKGRPAALSAVLLRARSPQHLTTEPGIPLLWGRRRPKPDGSSIDRTGLSATCTADLTFGFGLVLYLPRQPVSHTLVIVESPTKARTIRGFFGKIYLFFAGWADGQYLLVVVGLVTSVISIYYYISVIKMMVVKEPQEASDVVKSYPVPTWNLPGLQPLRTALIVCLLVTAVGGVLSNPLFIWANQAVEGTPLLKAVIAAGGSLPTG